MATVKMKCNCGPHAQDALHGEGIRVWNKTEKKSGDSSIFRCSVCHRESSVKREK